jgi:hypothetical protein
MVRRSGVVALCGLDSQHFPKTLESWEIYWHSRVAGSTTRLLKALVRLATFIQ